MKVYEFAVLSINAVILCRNFEVNSAIPIKTIHILYTYANIHVELEDIVKTEESRLILVQHCAHCNLSNQITFDEVHQSASEIHCRSVEGGLFMFPCLLERSYT